jgi:hypothetical protein
LSISQSSFEVKLTNYASATMIRFSGRRATAELKA